ncbi:hypothetical protein BDY19DRAFT_3607 [Irpex rosettiformis]|uniref:Uncharacterized protein n=1 Tax=Irpex rosettiformis TaxID=378272 RepID=A0ACB8UII4_9APHY|nr:hypothetical protein BDY19DRAFT_3607 [Irpex rosettiformis]
MSLFSVSGVALPSKVLRSQDGKARWRERWGRILSGGFVISVEATMTTRRCSAVGCERMGSHACFCFVKSVFSSDTRRHNWRLASGDRLVCPGCEGFYNWPEHHLKIPVNVLSDTVDTVNAWTPRPYASPSNSVHWPHSVQSSLFEERRQSAHMAPFVSISPPVSVSASPMDKKSASPSMKRENNGQEGLASSNGSTPPHSQMPASLSFSPSHYPVSELHSVLDEDIIINPQSKPRENPLSEHTPLSSNPASDPVEPATPISLSASFDDDDFHMPAQNLSPEISMIVPTSKDRSGIVLQTSVELHSLKATFRLSGSLGGRDAVEMSDFGLDRQSSSVESGSACAVEPVEASQQTSNGEPPLSVISSSLGSPDDKQLHGTRSSEIPVPSVKLVGTLFPTSLSVSPQHQSCYNSLLF